MLTHWGVVGRRSGVRSALPTVGDASFPVLETLPEKAANRSAPY